MPSKPILTIKGLTAGYTRLSVLHDLTLQIPQGQITGIIGPNGSGKSTLLNAISGMIRPTAGKIILSARDITRLSPDARCRLGIGRTFQVPRPFARMRVFENTLTAAAFGLASSRRDSWEAARAALAKAHLLEKKDVLADSLNLLDRKRLEIARAISARPGLLLLDEIAAGLSSEEVTEILEIVAALKAEGVTIIWIEHMMDTMLRAADTLVCMAEGRVALTGEPEEVLRSRAVEELYLGRLGEEAEHADGGTPAGEV